MNAFKRAWLVWLGVSPQPAVAGADVPSHGEIIGDSPLSPRNSDCDGRARTARTAAMIAFKMAPWFSLLDPNFKVLPVSWVCAGRDEIP